MYKLVESKDIIFLLSWFRGLFTAPSFEYFCWFVQAMMGLEKEGFVTNAYIYPVTVRSIGQTFIDF